MCGVRAKLSAVCNRSFRLKSLSVVSPLMAFITADVLWIAKCVLEKLSSQEQKPNHVSTIILGEWKVARPSFGSMGEKRFGDGGRLWSWEFSQKHSHCDSTWQFMAVRVALLMALEGGMLRKCCGLKNLLTPTTKTRWTFSSQVNFRLTASSA